MKSAKRWAEEGYRWKGVPQEDLLKLIEEAIRLAVAEAMLEAGKQMALEVEAEREECAKAAESLRAPNADCIVWSEIIARAIRARGPLGGINKAGAVFEEKR